MEQPELVSDFVKQIIDFVSTAPLWAASTTLFFCAFIEYVFPPFPGDTVLVAGGFFIAQGAVPFGPAAISLFCGSVAGSAAGWYLGFLAQKHERVRNFIFNLLGEANFERLLYAYARHGNLMLVVNRFIPAFRGVFVIGAGFTGISFSSVMIYGGISSLLWVALLIGLGFFLSENLSLLMYLFSTYTRVVIIVFVLFVALWFLRSYLKRGRKK